MQSRNLLNLGLLVLVIAMAAGVWWLQQHKTSPQTLSSLTASSVTRIEIPRDSGNIVLTKTNNLWRMTQPFKLPAHAFRVQTLLDLLAAPVTQTYNSNELDLTQFGLQPPRARILFNQTEIQFGKSHPVNYKRYLLCEQKIALLDDNLYPLVSAEAASLISLSLLETGNEIIKLELPELTLQKQADNRWQDAQGKTPAADKVQQLLDNWRHANAFAVHAYMPRTPAQKIAVHLDNQPVLHFSAYQQGEVFILGRADAGVEYHLDKQHQQQLLKL